MRVVEDGQKSMGRRVGERVVLVVYFRGEPTFIPANPNPKPYAALVAAVQKIKALVDEQVRDPAKDKLLGRMDERAAAAIFSQARVGAPKKR